MTAQGFKTYKPEELYAQDNIRTQDVIDIAKALNIKAIDENAREAIKQFATQAKAKDLTIKQAIAAFKSSVESTPPRSPQSQQPAGFNVSGHSTAPVDTLQARTDINIANAQSGQKLQGAMQAAKDLAAQAEGYQLMMELASGNRQPETPLELQLQQLAWSLAPSQNAFGGLFGDESAPFEIGADGQITIHHDRIVQQAKAVPLDQAFQTLRLAGTTGLPLLALPSADQPKN